MDSLMADNPEQEVPNHGSRKTGKESVTLSGRELIQLVIFTPVV
jgi:hypothetical protein